MSPIRVALLQIKTSKDYKENFKRAKDLVTKASTADILVLPEAFLFPYGTEEERSSKEIEEMIQELAAQTDNILVAGTVPEYTPEGVYNTSYVLGNRGKKVLGKYRKIHLFDVGLPGVNVTESDRYRSGEELGIIDTPYGKLGIAVCYDIRFPELFIRYAKEGVKMIVVPAAFSLKTGEVHWKILNQARALDSQSYVIGTTPARNPELDFPVYGGSIVVDPYGKVLTEADGKEQIVFYEFDSSYADSVREKLPVLRAKKEEVYKKER